MTQHTPRTDRDDRDRTGETAQGGRIEQVDHPSHNSVSSDSNVIADATALSRPTESRQLAIGGSGILGLGIILWVLAGAKALLVVVPVAVLWYAMSAPYAVAAVHVGLVALTASIPSVALVAFEVSAFAVLLGDIPEISDGVPGSLLLATATATVGLVAITEGSHSLIGSLWGAAGVLLVAFALSAYGLHRYAVVRRRLREGAYE